MNRPSSCHHEDFPCCGCGDECRSELDGTEDIERMLEQDGGDSDAEEYGLTVQSEEEFIGDDDGMSDVEADADTLRSCGWGCDEDYGYFDDESRFEADDGGF